MGCLVLGFSVHTQSGDMKATVILYTSPMAWDSIKHRAKESGFSVGKYLEYLHIAEINKEDDNEVEA